MTTPSRDELRQAAEIVLDRHSITIVQDRGTAFPTYTETQINEATLLLARDVMRRGDETKIDEKWWMEKFTSLEPVFHSGHGYRFSLHYWPILGEISIKFTQAHGKGCNDSWYAPMRHIKTREQVHALLESLGWGGVE